MAPEILTPEEFAQKLRIGRTTLFEWKRKGILVQGEHYIRIGRVVRFLWTDDLFASLREAMAADAAPDAALTKQRRVTSRQKPLINWDF